MDDSVRFKDFSIDPTPVRFKLEGDDFFAPPVLPIPVMQDLVKTIKSFKGLNPNDEEKFDQMMESVGKLFTHVLLPTCVDRFIERFNSKGTDTIGLNRAINILMWLLEEYGLRPTTPSSPLLNGLNDGETGTDSTDGVPNTELIPQHS